MRKFLLGVPLDDDSPEKIVSGVLNGSRYCQIFVNVHKIVQFNTNQELRTISADKDCVFSPDGRWIQWLAKIGGYALKKRFGGLEVLQRFCRLSEENGAGIYILGAKPDILRLAIEELKRRFPKAVILDSRHGYGFSHAAVVDDLRALRAKILFLALPTPQKELLGHKLFREIDSLCYVSGVGGALDILAGKSRRAPGWVQAIGMEWLYRCLQEPIRLSGRYFGDAVKLIRIIFTVTFIAEEAPE